MAGPDGLLHLRAGFIPLLDAAVLIAAAERGFAAEQGLALDLVRETSWANIRDRIAIGHFDLAHMLAPLPIAASLGLGSLAVPMVAPMALGLGGNAVTVSGQLWEALAAAGAPDDGNPASAGKALGDVIKARRRAGQGPITLGVVHPFSGHNYELRYWLGACGIDPERDVSIVVVPPPFMPDALAAGRIDGYCVGEPWNTVAVATGAGRIVTTKAAIWRSSPEKVLGLRADWASANGEAVTRLLLALYRASQWCDDPVNHVELAEILARPAYLDMPAERLLPGLAGCLALGASAPAAIPDFLLFARKAGTFPWISHALWFYSQMVRWGQAALTPEGEAAVRATYRPDLYRAAIQQTGAALPSASSKVEGALQHEQPVSCTSGNLILGPDGFFDGRAFDPDALVDYVASQPFSVRNFPPN